MKRAVAPREQARHVARSQEAFAAAMDAASQQSGTQSDKLAAVLRRRLADPGPVVTEVRQLSGFEPAEVLHHLAPDAKR